MWASLFHRVSGLVLVGWIVVYVAEQATLTLGADFHDRFRQFITTGPFRLLEVGVIAAALYHALNGLRLVAIDVWPVGAGRRHRELLQVQTGVFFALFTPAAWVILARFFDIG